jgi:hypothetical protein
MLERTKNGLSKCSLVTKIQPLKKNIDFADSRLIIQRQQYVDALENQEVIPRSGQAKDQTGFTRISWTSQASHYLASTVFLEQ